VLVRTPRQSSSHLRPHGRTTATCVQVEGRV